MSKAHKWLFCRASHNSVGIAPPGVSSLCRRKHLRPWGEASRKETKRPASSLSLSTELWQTNTSYFRLHRDREFRTDCDCSSLDGDDVDGEPSADADEVVDDTLRDDEFFVTSCSRCVDLKSFWNQS